MLSDVNKNSVERISIYIVTQKALLPPSCLHIKDHLLSPKPICSPNELYRVHPMRILTCQFHSSKHFRPYTLIFRNSFHK